ncbi:MAG TPA: zinc metallopeptidase [Thermoanaerobaculia bacterium]|nr:zinc metallopeptidase [Thermoanaerobaculia bacterium]
MIFDPLWLLFITPALLLSLWASFRTRSAFKKYSKVAAASGLSGAQAAQRLLSSAGISDVDIVATRGTLSDHYNPATKKLALSEPVYGQRSIAAIGVACHEAGHAIQHARGYKPLWLRSALVPLAGIGSQLGYIVMFVGLMMMFYAGGSSPTTAQTVVLVGAVLFSATLLFQIVTLPVEFDASSRAKRLAVEQGIVLPQERQGMDRVLNAAALTYVAAAISTLMTLLYFLFRAGLLGGRRN